jgi:hypothetical protein
MLLEAQMQGSRGEPDAAVHRFAAAAELAEQLAACVSPAQDQASSWQHRYTALSCWAQAGNFYAAIVLAYRLLDDTNLSPEIRRQVEAFASTVRLRRVQLRSVIPVTASP